MSNRREFLRSFALLGIVVSLAVPGLFAQDAAPPKPEGDGQFAVSYAEAVRQNKPPARKITIPDAGEYKVLKGDFHIHTIYSDGAVKPEARVQEAADNGLDVIAITDHVESSGSRGFPKDIDRNMSYNLAKSEAEKQKLILVHGTEISQTTVPGHLSRHFNALFITDANPIQAVAGDWKAMIAAAAEQEAFIHWNHPAHGAMPNIPGRLAFPFLDELEEARAKGHIHGIEVFNGVWYYPFAHDWCNERDLVPIANSDIHASEWNNYGHQNLQRPMTLILARERNLESVREAFFAKRTIGWAGNMVFGREPWVEELFRACVEIKKTEDGLTLHNRSDIPCLIETDGKTSELPPQGSLEIATTEKLTVTNWLTGSQKPLEIAP
ncbi:MAG: PHP domain-containing protein [Planctomycetaceae bacterium]|nr:PHP domain-containing protein [Planctomycetaceae bacterium]